MFDTRVHGSFQDGSDLLVNRLRKGVDGKDLLGRTSSCVALHERLSSSR